MTSTSPPSTKRRSPAAVAVGSGILLSRISGLVRERVFAYYMGNSDASGAFRAALRIPNLLQNLFGEGVLSASFVPSYARLIAEGKTEEAGRVAGVILSALTLCMAVLVLVGVTYTRGLIEILAPGFHGEVRELTIQLVRIMFPGVALLVLSAWCLGILNSHRLFFLSYVAPVLWNISVIAALFACGGGTHGTQDQMRLAVQVAWGTVVGAVLQLAVQVPTALRLNGGLSPSLDLRLEPVRVILKNFFPALLTRGVVQISAYIDQVLASFLGPAAVSAMAYSQTLSTLPVALFGMSISTAELTEMSRTVGSEADIRTAIAARLSTGLRRLAFFIIPSSVAFVLLGDVLSAMLFQTGKFGREDSRFVWYLLIGGSVGLLSGTQARLCTSAFWALRDTRTPARFAGIRVLLTGILGFIATFPAREHFHWDVAWTATALVGSAGISGWIEFLLIRRSLRRRIGPFDPPLSSIGQSWIAALVGAVAGRLLIAPLASAPPWASGLAICGVYGAIYEAILLAFGSPEAKRIWNTAVKRFR